MSKCIQLLLLLIAFSNAACGADETPHIDDVHDPHIEDTFVFPPPPEPVQPPGIQRRATAPQSETRTTAAAMVSQTSITSPVGGSNLQSTTTFQWSDEGAVNYLFRLSAVACYEGDIVNEFGIPGATTSYTATGIDTAQRIYASIWARTVVNGTYRARDCAVYNVDADGDGIYNEIDPNPNQFDETNTYLQNGERLSVVPTGRAAILEISQTLYNQLSSGNTNNLEDITNTLYTFFDDEFDFIFITNDQTTAAASYAGRYHPTQNDIQGIGGSIFNVTANWGSDNAANPASNDGRLQGVVHFPTLTSFSRGPGLHELMHRWGNRLDSIPDGGTGSHWGFSSGGGQLGGWAPSSLQNLGGGEYQANNGRPGSSSFGLIANGGNGLPFSNIELYLMGMIPHDELENVAYAVNGVWVNSSNGTFSADQIVTVTPAQILNTDGARVPSSSTSQKSFNVLNVIVTTASVSSGEIGNMDEEAYRFGLAGNEGTSSYNFWEATGGRGTLNIATALSALKPELTPVEEDEAICFPIKVEGSGTATICL